MQSDRDTIFQNIRNALAPLKQRTPYPEWDESLVVCKAHPQFGTTWELFAHKMAQVNGTPLRGLQALAKWMAERKLTLGYCDPDLIPTVRPLLPGVTLETTFDRKRVDDYAFGITLAAGAIAETGSVILTDHVTPSRLGALAPWTHIALLRPDHLHRDIPSALRALGNDPSVVWCTGPSKTADVEGILIEGVHGPGIQVCCLWE